MPSTSTGKKRGKRAELAEWLARAAPQRVGEPQFAELLRVLAPVSEGYLRKLLRESTVPLAPTVEGVRQSTLVELERSLCALLVEYETAGASERAAIRRLVIPAKDRARWLARKDPVKGEMLLWMQTWLENPPLFPRWVEMRKRRVGAG